MPAFPKPSATETDPVASPAVSAEATARAEADAAHAALTTSAHGGIVASAEKGAANGVATLDGSGRLPASQQTIGVFEYQGTWNASTNSPTLADGTGTKGFLYRVATGGSRNLGSGSITFDVGDYVIHNGTAWEKADTTDAVSSVNGRTGAVTGLAEQTAVTAVEGLVGTATAEIAAHEADTTAAHAASAISFTPASTIAATDAQSAIVEALTDAKAYADTLIAAADAMVMKGVIDCSANPNYPAADRGWTYRVSVAGKIGGASGVNVEAGDLLLCLTDGTSAGNQATVGSAWSIAQTNLDGAVIGPASSVDARIATFSGTSGKVIQDGGLLIADLIAKGIIDAKGDLIVGTADNAYARKAVGANTRVLAADSTQSDGLAWVDAQPVIPTPVAGGYYPWTFANAAQANAEGIIMFCPVILPPGTIDRIMMSVLTTPGSAGSVHRLGLYTQRAGSRFGTMDLLVDAGTVATTSTGDKEATVSVTLTVPTLAFIACVQQGAPTTRAAVRSGGTNVESQIGSGATGPFHNGLGGLAYVGAVVSGALPSTAVGTVEFNKPHWGVVRYA